MRKLKLTPLFLLASVFGLSACTLPSWLSFLSFIPGLDAPEKEEKEEEKKEEEEEPKEETPKYTALGIMQDIGEFAWGYTEDGDFNEPDEDGVVESNYTIGYDVENPEDSEACLSGVFNDMVESEGFPEYLSVYLGPVYTANAITSVTPNLGVSEIVFRTDDNEFDVFMYDYCYQDSVSVVFMCGPAGVFFEQA